MLYSNAMEEYEMHGPEEQKGLYRIALNELLEQDKRIAKIGRDCVGFAMQRDEYFAGMKMRENDVADARERIVELENALAALVEPPVPATPYIPTTTAAVTRSADAPPERTLPHFGPCVKCWGERIKLRYMRTELPSGKVPTESMECRCPGCGYVWRQPCLDAPEKTGG